MSRTSVIIDSGSNTTKVGLSGEDKPKILIPTLVGRVKAENDKTTIYVGKKALQKSDSVFTFPMEYGCVTNWDDMERVWKKSFKQVGIAGKDASAVLTEVPGNPKENREEVAKIFFEKFEARDFYLGTSAVFGLYASGKTRGIVLDMGHQLSYAVPVFDGMAIASLVQDLHFSGEVLNNHLKHLLEKNNVKIDGLSQVEDIKHNLCYVAEEFDAELSKVEDQVDKKYVLPDGKEISVGFERFLCPEALFQPTLGGFEAEGIHTVTRKLIKKCVSNTKVPSTDFYENIVFIGGTTEFKNIGKRMQKEIQQLVPKKKVVVYSPQGRRFSAWIGGSLLASMDTMDQCWITKKDYEEHGAQIIHKKCPI
jgi:actin